MDKKLSFFISIAAIVISIIAISCVYFRWTPFTFDSLGFFGWITGALSVIVMVLAIIVGLNYTGFKKQTEDLLNKTKNEIIDIISGQKDECGKIFRDTIDRKLYNKLNQEAHDCYNRGDYTKSFFKELEAASISPSVGLSAIITHKDRYGNEIKSFSDNVSSRGSTLLDMIKNEGYNDYCLYDVTRARYLLNIIYIDRNREIPADLEELLNVMESTKRRQQTNK